MATKTIEDVLRGLEKRYWQALQDQDVDAALRLTDEPCIVTGAQGVGMIDRMTLASMMKDANYTLKRFELKEGAHVRLLRDDVAILAYQVHEELTVDGKPVSLDAADSSTWVRREGRWLCAMHTEALAGDPFGRDRRPVT
jgi:ketosteroid isomerase-like protein